MRIIVHGAAKRCSDLRYRKLTFDDQAVKILLEDSPTGFLIFTNSTDGATNSL